MMETTAPVFGGGDWELLERTTLFQRFFRVDLLTLRHKLYEGGWSAPVQRELLMRRPAVAVLPYDSKHGLVALVEQFRVGATRDRESPWCLELIAGIADVAGEPMEQLARREAMEEAALVLGKLEPITSYLPSPGGCDERLHLFASECDLSEASGIHGKPAEGENIRVATFPMDAIPALLASGRVDNAASIIALQWLLLQGRV
jgi:ADP-ribose pyrophosphatase